MTTLTMRTTTTITTMRNPFQLAQPSKYLGLYISTKHLYRKKGMNDLFINPCISLATSPKIPFFFPGSLHFPPAPHDAQVSLPPLHPGDQLLLLSTLHSIRYPTLKRVTAFEDGKT